MQRYKKSFRVKAFKMENVKKSRHFLSFSINDASDGEQDNEECKDISPNVCNARACGNGVIFWNEPFACERIEDCAVRLKRTIACICDSSWHREGVRHVETKNV